ncbi:helix-turn-helix transcriptional regulator [Niabella pedocola]|uniref:Helix-turn-helix transcriptional regulator n=1 Tax=Niabella pedocola TaxID=1752077 RepID=A0ABS8PXP1_9BACT|nr:helix-turn-helix transcriptional regulator [Niabella pedocola]MCD2425810.1 helix-turn-helix transcriptional regulator [Niabella pedocola]
MGIDVQDFFKPIHFNEHLAEEDYEKVRPLIDFAKSISQVTYQSVYLVDYYKRGFIYVSDNPIFLCGNTPRQVLEDGFLYYLKHVPQEDLELLLKINEAGFAFFGNLSKDDRLKFSISYDFHLKQPTGNLLMINHKLKPLLLDQHANPWIALCLVSLSSHTTSGHIRFKSKELKQAFEFNLATDTWEAMPIIQLNKREREILIYSVQGFTMEQIASKIYVSIDTVKFHKKNLFAKLGVKNITEATAAAIDQALI